MSLQIMDSEKAPAGRSSSAARSIPEYDEAVRAAKSLAPGKVIVLTLTEANKKVIGGKNPLNSLAQTLRVVFRKEGWERVAYTVPKTSQVCIRVGKPRENAPRRKTTAN